MFQRRSSPSSNSWQSRGRSLQELRAQLRTIRLESIYVAFCLRIGIDYLRPDYQEISSFIEYIAKHTPTPSTIRSKISQRRVFILLADRSTAGVSHPHTERALDAIDKDKTYIPRVKVPIPPDVLKDIFFFAFLTIRLVA